MYCIFSHGIEYRTEAYQNVFWEDLRSCVQVPLDMIEHTYLISSQIISIKPYSQTNFQVHSKVAKEKMLGSDYSSRECLE